MSDDTLHVTGGVVGMVLILGLGGTGGQVAGDYGALAGLITGAVLSLVALTGLVRFQRRLKLRAQAEAIDEEVAATEEREEQRGERETVREAEAEDLPLTHTRL